MTERPARSRSRPRRLARMGPTRRLARKGLALLTPLTFAAALVIPGSPAAQAITLNAPMVGITAAAKKHGTA